jgi:hypothetical protein
MWLSTWSGAKDPAGIFCGALRCGRARAAAREWRAARSGVSVAARSACGLAFEGPIRRTRGGSEWEPINILIEGDRGSNKMNTVSNTHLRLTTQVGLDDTATGVLLVLGTNNQLHRPEDARNTNSSLTDLHQSGR